MSKLYSNYKFVKIVKFMMELPESNWLKAKKPFHVRVG